MAILLADEFRLAYALLLQAAPLIAAWRFVSRHARGDETLVGRAADTLLLTLLIEYASVCVPGALRFLSPVSIAIVTVVASGALILFSRPRHPREGSVATKPLLTEVSKPRVFTLACALFAFGYVAALAYLYRHTPVLANDALTYHFPAAVHWLQQGRVAIFETWFFNPANAYSPLAGSAFITFLIAPLGNDVLARHVQLPALALIFFSALRLMRTLGVRPAIAGLCGVALVLAQPFLRQSIIEKDDLFLAAFATAAVAACGPHRLRGPLGPARLGVALGLLLATKYTALLTLPALALLIDAPVRASWRPRHYATVIGLVLLVAGPWYARNLVLTGNPVYPLRVFSLPGLFTTTRSDAFTTLGGAWDVLTGRGQGLPAAPLIPLLALLVAGIFTHARRTPVIEPPHLGRAAHTLATDPVLRAVLLGPPIATAVFFTLSPYPESRFLYPAFALLYVAGAVAVTRLLANPRPQLAAAILLILLPAWLTGIKFTFSGEGWAIVGQLALAAATVSAAGLGIATFLRRAPNLRRHAALTAALAVAVAVYVEWPAFIHTCRETAPFYYAAAEYGAAADAWQFVRTELPPDQPLAYANTFLVHPLTGFDHRRPLVYVPTRSGVNHLTDLPPIPGPLSGERLNPAANAVLIANPDPQQWLEKLRASKATHLILFKFKFGAVPDPPEQSIIRARADRFESLFNNDAATVYRLHL